MSLICACRLTVEYCFQGERMATRLEELRQQRQALAEQKADLQKKNKSACQRERRKGQQWLIEGELKRVALTIYVVCDYALEPAVDYLRMRGKAFGWPDKGVGEIELLFIQALESYAEEELLTLTDELTTSNAEEAQEAHKYALEWAMALWTALQNEFGIFPSTAAILWKLEQLRLAIPPELRPKSWGLGMTATSRKQASRWRRRRGVRIGKVYVKEKLAADEVQKKTLALWQWSNYLLTQVPASKKPLWVNMDETGICLCPGTRRGNVFLNKAVKPVQHGTRGQQRSYLTHVAFICDDKDIQLKLPQVIIGNARTIPAERLDDLRASCPANVHLWREESAWVNGAKCSKILGLLREALAQYRDTHQVIFVFDAYKPHFGWAVWPMWLRAELWPLVVSAKMTSKLQPLDTHAFAAFKLRLQRLFQDARVDNFDAFDILGALLKSIIGAIQQVLEAKDWSSAFSNNGLTHRQRKLGNQVKSEIGGRVVKRGAVPDSKPTVEQLALCFPKRTRVPETALFRPLISKPNAFPGVLAASSAASPQDLTSTGVWPIALRTRGRLAAISASADSTSIAGADASTSMVPIAFRTRSRLLATATAPSASSASSSKAP